MPKIVDYAVRFDCIREAVYAITLREGADAIDLPAVAEELSMSVSSVRRLLCSAVHLPELGLQWVDRRARIRSRRPVATGSAASQPWVAAGEALLLELPATPGLRDDALVWSRLTLGFSTRDWARDARNGQQLLLSTLVDRAIPEELAAAEREFETTRLLALMMGATEAVCTGAIRPEESVPMVRRHLADLGSVARGERSGAA